jgi:hypothetical protein
MGNWRLKGILTTGCAVYAEMRKYGVILRCEGSNSWREKLMNKRFTDPETGIRKSSKCEQRHMDKNWVIA